MKYEYGKVYLALFEKYCYILTILIFICEQKSKCHISVLYYTLDTAKLSFALLKEILIIKSRAMMFQSFD